eukprot:5921687-Pyramimonas_sp.AAC.2
MNKLSVLAESNNGFEIAERDLEQRGRGDVFGTAQTQTGVPRPRLQPAHLDPHTHLSGTRTPHWDIDSNPRTRTHHAHLVERNRTPIFVRAAPPAVGGVTSNRHVSNRKSPSNVSPGHSANSRLQTMRRCPAERAAGRAVLGKFDHKYGPAPYGGGAPRCRGAHRGV